MSRTPTLSGGAQNNTFFANTVVKPVYTNLGVIILLSTLFWGCHASKTQSTVPDAKHAQNAKTPDGTKNRQQQMIQQPHGTVKPMALSPTTVTITEMQVVNNTTYLTGILEQVMPDHGLFGQLTMYRICGPVNWNGRRTIAVQTLNAELPSADLKLGKAKDNKNLKKQRALAGIRLRVDGALARIPRGPLTLPGCYGTTHSPKMYRGLTRQLNIKQSASVEHNPKLPQLFNADLGKWFQKWGKQETFSTFADFASARLQQTGNGHTDLRKRWSASDGDMASLMDFYTGQTNVKNAMSTAMGLGLPHKAEARTIDMSTIEGVRWRHRDYKKLLEADNNPTPTLDPLSRYLPGDAITATFQSVGEFSALTDLLDNQLGHLARVIENAPGPFNLIDRYSAQLALDFKSLAAKLPPSAAGNMALVLLDPYLREGTSVSLIFEHKNKSDLAEVLNQQASLALKKFAGKGKLTFTINGQTVTLFQSPDHTIKRYQIQLKEITIVSNSKGALTRLLDIYQQPSKSLAQTPDYLYARAIVPFDAHKESAFVFMGDSLMVKLTSPRAKIMEARRMMAQAKLKTVNYAALLFGWMEGRAPSSLQELLDSPWLMKSDLKHADQSPISFDPLKGASSKWGQAHQLIPVIDIPESPATQSEKKAYETFRRNYNRQWSGNLDPTLIRFVRNPDTRTVDVDIHILPIAPTGQFATEYADIRRQAGKKRVIHNDLNFGVSGSVALGRTAKIKRATTKALRLFSGQNVDAGIFGNWASFGMADRAVLWNLLVNSDVHCLGICTDPAEVSARDYLTRHLMQFPVWSAIQINDEAALRQTLDGFRDFFLQVQMASAWQKNNVFEGIDITRITFEGKGDLGPVTVYYAILKKMLVASLHQDVLEEQISLILSGKHAEDTEDLSKGSQFVANINLAKQQWLQNILLLLTDRTAFTTHQHAARGFEILKRGLSAFENNKALEQHAINYLGYVPLSPQGTAFTWSKSEQAVHPIYGSEHQPTIPNTLKQKTPLHQELTSIRSVHATVETKPRGREFEFIAKIRLQLAN